MPDHISSRAEDLSSLLSGRIDNYEHLLKDGFDPVLLATILAFGFVFIHPKVFLFYGTIP